MEKSNINNKINNNKWYFKYKYIKKISNIIILYKFILIIIINYIFFFNKLKIKNINNRLNNKDYKKHKFAILRRLDCSLCGLFSYYIVYLGCINKYIKEGFIPIIDLQSFKNIFNGFKVNLSIINPWELFFLQPYNYKLNIIKKKARKIYYFECKPNIFRPNESIFFNKTLNNYWHNIAQIYIPIKSHIVLEAKTIITNLFNKSNNILGVLIRGTDYTSIKPKDHPIQPTPQMVIRDIKKYNKKNKYKWIFISTEDDLIREIFKKEFGQILKFLKFNKELNYSRKQFLANNENIKGNLQFIKIYLLNMIILSKCIDFIGSQTSGGIGIFIFKKKFRYVKVYNLGIYD